MAQKSDYQLAVEASEKHKGKLTQKQKREIREMYTEIAYDLSQKIKKTNPEALTYQWLNSYKQSLLQSVDALNKQLNARIQKNMRAAAQLAVNPQLSLFADAADKYGIGRGQFDNVFAAIPDDVVKNILSGKLYQDGRTLNARLWSAAVQNGKDIEYIIARGIASKKSAYDLAKDLETYVNPEAKKDWDWGNVYPGCAKNVEYNAQRLARTAIQHAYQQAQKQSCKRNPYVVGIRWRSAEIHGRTCVLCKERHNQNAYDLGQGVYPVDELPLDHPNGLCSTFPVLGKSLEDIGQELGDWLRGGSNPMLDRWYNQYGNEFAGATVIASAAASAASAGGTAKTAEQLRVEMADGVDIIKEDAEAYMNSEIALLPAAHRKLAEDMIRTVQVTGTANSGYSNGVLYLNNQAMDEPGVFVHEFAHALEEKLDLFNDTQFLQVLSAGLENVGFGDIVDDDGFYGASGPVVIQRIKTEDSKFISDYQSRFYDEDIYGNPRIDMRKFAINLKCLREYFSEGYKEFLLNPKHLRQKDEALYHYIEEMMKE